MFRLMLLLAATLAVASPAKAQVQPGDCWAVIPSESGKNRMFLHLDKNYYILYDNMRFQRDLDGAPHEITFGVRTYYDIMTNEIIAADVGVSMRNTQTGDARYIRNGERQRFVAILPGGQQLNGYGGLTLISRRPGVLNAVSVDPALAAQLHADLIGSRPIDLRYFVTRGGVDIVSLGFAKPYAAKPNYIAWARRTARDLATQRMNSGECPMRRNFQ